MTESATYNPEQEELSILLIPLADRQLVLPNVAVAEIISYSAPSPDEGTALWSLGQIEWRSESIPLISLEQLNDASITQQPSNDRIIVINGIVDSEQLPYCALVVAGVPRQMRIGRSEIIEFEGREIGPAEKRWVSVNGEQAVIPDLDWIQQQVIDAA